MIHIFCINHTTQSHRMGMEPIPCATSHTKVHRRHTMLTIPLSSTQPMFQIAVVFTTIMHSSRMCTAMVIDHLGDVCPGVVCVCPSGVSALRGLPGRVSAQGGCLPMGCLPRGGVCHTSHPDPPCEQNHRQL